MAFAGPLRVASFTAVALVASLRFGPIFAQTPAPARSPNAQAAADVPTIVIKSQHRRMPFPRDIQRIAVGDPKILLAELITSREVLVLGQETGRTTLIVWFTNGSFSEMLFSVERDLSVLERALKRVNPSIEVESAPDRDALVLTGVVPNVGVRQKAEDFAIDYLNAGSKAGGSGPVQAAAGATTAGSDAGSPLSATASPSAGAQNPAATQQAPTAAAGSAATVVQLLIQPQVASPPSGRIINQIEIETLTLLPEQKIQDAIRTIGGVDVTIRRVLHGDVRNDLLDTLVLEGHVANQIALVRVLTVTAQLFACQNQSVGTTGSPSANTGCLQATMGQGQGQGISVVADEAGALAEQQQGQGQSAQSQSGGGSGAGGATSSQLGGGRGARLTNQIRTNIGRAKAIQLAGGRIL